MRIWRHLATTTAIALLAMAAQGCHSYGARGASVRLETSPPGATAYLVTPGKWKRITAADQPLAPYTPKDLNAFRKLLEEDRVKSRRTPVETTALPYQTILVVERGGRFWWREINVKSPGVADPTQVFDLDLTE